jgi:hypothetical protein
LRMERKIPELPPPDAIFTTGGATATSAVPISPLPQAPDSFPTIPPVTTPRSQPKVGTSQPRPPLTSDASGGQASTFPLPFPSFALPSSLPPLPSGFPTAIPTSFPTALPSFLPPFPGLTPAAPVSSSQATQNPP